MNDTHEKKKILEEKLEAAVQVEEMLGIASELDRLLEATHQVMMSSLGSKRASEIFQLDERKFYYHVRWFKALQNFSVEGECYFKDPGTGKGNSFINLYHKRYPKK